MRAVVSGMIATYPVGGVVWDYLQYALGLERLGFEVWYLEDNGMESYDPGRRLYGEDSSYGASYLEAALRLLSPTLHERFHFRDIAGRTYGASPHRLEEVLASADIFLNVSGSALLRDETMRCARKVLIDTDPGWNQFVNFPRWDSNPGWQGTHGYRAHDHFFTYAERMGASDCRLPDLGLTWHPTRPPVVLDCWSEVASRVAAAAPLLAPWTTVMTWDNFRKPILHRGERYGTKEMEFPRFEHLPRRLPGVALEVAVGGSEPPVERWREMGWRIVDSHDVSVDAVAYRDYIQRSRGEWSVAKNVYVATRSGWFSCRSVCYLASGLPVVLQDTGFSAVVPVGRGLHAFSTEDEAAETIAKVEASYDRERRAALDVAREHFASEVVLKDLLRRVGLD